MHTILHPADRALLRVLLIGSVSGASLALADWLQQRERVAVAGPVAATAAVDALAAAHRPQVVVLDVDGLAVPLGKYISQLKTLAPPPTLIVLACDASDALRRHCYGAGVDVVFAKTKDLEGLANLLAVLHRSLEAGVSAASVP